MIGQPAANGLEPEAQPGADREDVVSGCAIARDEFGAGIEVDLVHDQGGGDVVGLGEHEQPVDDGGNRRGLT